MSKLAGISGGMSGRTGSFVFRQRNGQTIVAQHQPVVKNPNSTGQQETRAKFKLMTQLAAIMKAGFGTMGVTRRPARSKANAFFSLNQELVEIDSTTDGMVAKIPMEQLQLTDSNTAFGTLEVESGTTNIKVTIDTNTFGGGKKSGKVVLVGYGTMGVTKRAFIQQIVDVPAVDGIISYNFEGLPGGNYTILSYGILETTSGQTKIDLDNIHTPSDEDYISAVILDAAVADGVVAETLTVGANATIVGA